MYWGDILLYFQPMYEHIRQSLIHGRLDLWNEYVLSGQPMLGNPQAPILYPPTLLLHFTPVWLFLTVSALFHLTVCGVGMYLYLQRLCGSHTASLCGALAFCGGGYMMARLQFPTMAASACWLPWMLITFEMAVCSPSLRNTALAAVPTALTLLAGHPQMGYLNISLSLVWAAWRFRTLKQGQAPRAACAVVSALLLGAALAAGQLVPMLQLFAHSARADMTWMQANRFVLLPQHLLTLLLPNYFGHPNHADYWGPGNLWEPCIYVGLVPLFFLCIALRRMHNNPTVRFFGYATVVGFLLAFGRFGGLFYLAYHLVPGVKAFHDPARFAYIGVFGLCVLAAFGIAAVEHNPQPKLARIIRWMPLLTALNLIWYCGRLTPAAPRESTYMQPANLHQIPRSAKVYTFDRDDMWKRFLTYSDYGPPGLRYPRVMLNALAPNTGMLFGIADAGGYEPVPVRAATELEGIVRNAVERHAPNMHALLSMLGAEMVLMPQSTRYISPGLIPVSGSGGTRYNLKPSAPARIVHKALVAENSREAMSILADPAFDPDTQAVVLHHPGNLGVPSPADSVEQLRSSNSEFEFLASAQGGGLMVVPQTLYPGWRATVNGVRVPLVRANHAQIGVAIPPGASRIRLRYDPDAVRIGLFITLAACCCVTAVFAASRREVPLAG